MKAWVREKVFQFKNPAITSRNTLIDKTSYFIFLENEQGEVGIGECSPIYGLSLENKEDLLKKITSVIDSLNKGSQISELDLLDYPSLRFALEVASIDLNNGGKRMLFENNFSAGRTPLLINGLIWMGDIENMNSQLDEKIEEGFECIKIKIGSHEFKKELEFLSTLREEYGNELEIRLDANGAFSADEALIKLRALSEFNIHSIEQPIKHGQWQVMSQIVEESLIPIALDEELIGITGNKKSELLSTINPHYIILKPTLLGGLSECDDWIKRAESLGIEWWATSFLESNLGLNAIAQWVSSYNVDLHQGLGTGSIYKNNINSPLTLDGEMLRYSNNSNWDLQEFQK